MADTRREHYKQHDCGQSGCRVLHTMLSRVAAGEPMVSVERDYDLCPGTLAPIVDIVTRATKGKRHG